MLRVPGTTNRRSTDKRANGIRLSIVLFLLLSSASISRSSRVLASSQRSTDGAGRSGGATLRPASSTSPDIPFSDYDSEAERQLLELVNAARAHAEAMFLAKQLSHRFDGEPSLPQRLAAATRTQLDQEGENVALDFDAAAAQQHLMLSPPHRSNLLNPAYNVVGLGAVRNGDRLYIVQDFGHALPSYSAAQVKELIAVAVVRTRRQANQPALARRDLPEADDAACSMAQADRLGTSPVHQLAQRYTVLSYTSLHP